MPKAKLERRVLGQRVMCTCTGSEREGLVTSYRDPGMPPMVRLDRRTKEHECTTAALISRRPGRVGRAPSHTAKVPLSSLPADVRDWYMSITPGQRASAIVAGLVCESRKAARRPDES